MNKHRWKECLYDLSLRPGALRRFVLRHIDLFDDYDRKVMRLARSWDWPNIAAAVRAELRQGRGEPYDPNTIGQDPKNRLYHVVRRVIAPVGIMPSLKARRLNRVTL